MNTQTELHNREIVLSGNARYRMEKLCSAEEIRRRIDALAARLRADYADKNPVLIGILKGCFIFMSDLVRAMAIPCEMDFLKLSSYGDRMTAGQISLLKDVDIPLADRHVILVEDIVDTGKSLAFLLEHLRARRPASLEMAAMFVKPRPQTAAAEAKYVGMTIPDQFVIGYGLDYAQQWRHLPDLYALVEVA